jgi:hypothetical protein
MRRSRPLGTVALVMALTAAVGCGDVERQPRQPNEPPTATLRVPERAIAGRFTLLDGSGSSDPDGVLVEYRFAPGDTDELLITGEPTLAYVYGEAGDYVVTLTVVDDLGGTAFAEAPITVRSE